MTAYRFQARYQGQYYDGIVQAFNAEDAGDAFAQLIAEKKIQPKVESVYRKDKCFVTYEEIKDEGNTISPSQEDKLGK